MKKLDFSDDIIFSTSDKLNTLQRELKHEWWRLHAELGDTAFETERSQREVMKRQAELFALIDELGSAKMTVNKLKNI